MTQAFNLSQLANNLNSSGQLDASDGLVNAVPVGNGGTGVSTLTGVPYGNGTNAFTAATSTQLKTAIGTLAVGDGGTGATSFTSGSLLKGNGTSALGVASASDIVSAIGATYVSNATYASSAGYASTAGNGGVTSVNGNTGAVTVAAATTTNVLSATAGATAGAIGTYTFAVYDGGSVISSNGTTSGQNFTTVMSGTWKNMQGYSIMAGGNGGVWLRVS